MSKRGAKPIPAPDSVGPVLDGELLEARNQQIAVMNEHNRQIIEQFGDGLPYVRDLYIAENRRDIRHAAEAAVRVGRRLIVMKAHEAHGEWLNCLAQIGIDPATASRMMLAARRLMELPNDATAQKLTAMVGGQGKLFELLSLPQEQFAELATEGEIDGLTLEDVERMTVRELREAVREARADMHSKDERAAKREAEIDALQKELRKARNERARAKPDDELKTLREKVSGVALQARADIAAQGDDVDSLFERFTQLREKAVQLGLDATEQDLFMAGLIGELMGDLRFVRDSMGLPIVNDHGAPDWAQG